MGAGGRGRRRARGPERGKGWAGAAEPGPCALVRIAPPRVRPSPPDEPPASAFPLGLVLYPGEPLPLHIFEFRYREMARLCLDEGRPFGVVRAADDAIAGVGCTARIRRVLRRFNDGRMDLLCAGETRFRVREVFQDRPYLTAETWSRLPRATTRRRCRRRRASASSRST